MPPLIPAEVTRSESGQRQQECHRELEKLQSAPEALKRSWEEPIGRSQGADKDLGCKRCLINLIIFFFLILNSKLWLPPASHHVFHWMQRQYPSNEYSMNHLEFRTHLSFETRLQLVVRFPGQETNAPFYPLNRGNCRTNSGKNITTFYTISMGNIAGSTQNTRNRVFIQAPFISVLAILLTDNSFPHYLCDLFIWEANTSGKWEYKVIKLR